MRLRPSVTAMSVAWVVALAGCVEPANPCDPDADPDVAAQGTVVKGRVVNQRGEPRGGIAVAVTGRPQTAVSAADGSFTLQGLPPAPAYDIVALPAAPVVGGRTRTGALACRTELDGITLVVVEPPPSPEVEIVRASGERRLVVAFGGLQPVDPEELTTLYQKGTAEGGTQDYRSPENVGADCRAALAAAPTTFRVQVRAPFSPWVDAVVTPFPWAPEPDPDYPASALPASALYFERIDDVCSAALCSQFAYLDGDLATENARCAEVVGTLEGTGAQRHVQPLEPFASYHVRVLAEEITAADAQTTHALPPRVEGAAAGAGQISLVPGAVLPVVDASGAGRNTADANVVTVTAVAGGRFAVVERDQIVVIGDGFDALGTGADSDVEGAGQGAQATDGEATAQINDAWAATAPPDAEPVLALPAGDWLRVLRHSTEATSDIVKLYVGVSHDVASEVPTDELAQNRNMPALAFDPAAPAAGAVRAMSYLLRTSGTLATDGTNPPDVYLILHQGSLLLAEQTERSEGADPHLAYFSANNVVTDWGNSLAPLDPASPVKGEAMQTERCNALGAVTAGDYDPAGDLVGVTDRISVCLDVERAIGEPVELADAEVLDAAGGDPLEGRHLLTDARNDRVLVARARDLLCSDCAVSAPVPIASTLVDNAVAVGREPRGMTRSRVLRTCDGDEQDVVLVANAGSGDVSVLALVDERVEEIEVIPLPSAPVGFLDDADGPSCADPFAWAVGEDGRVFPIDMRGSPGVPLCDERSCEVGTRGRAAAGAVARPITGPQAGRARALVGGVGLLGELGFFKPRALAGAAYLGGDEFKEELPAESR